MHLINFPHIPNLYIPNSAQLINWRGSFWPFK